MTRAPLVRGALWALAASLAFGIATPLIALARGGAGAWITAATLYAGAALLAAPLAGSPRASLATLRRNARTYLAIAALGGMLAPAAFAAGLARAGPFGASLALNMEVIFSIVLATAFFHEHAGPRIVVACSAILAGGALLAAQDRAAIGSAAGIGLVVGATALWAIDNALSSSLHDADPRVTVFWKALLGATGAFAASRALHETIPGAVHIAELAAIGAVGYGASLWAYLRAQRTFGIARTASLFATAPFVGAVASFAFHPSAPQATTYAVVLLMALGVALHATERHAHRHGHLALAHVHLHRHDDGHHAHAHEAVGATEHLHAHRHDALVHTHDHAPDPHHDHDHDRDEPRSAPTAT